MTQTSTPNCLFSRWSATAFIALLLGLSSLTGQAQSNATPATRYVKPSATGTGSGSSWANASSDLQAMINASTTNDQVWVAAGTYKPGGNANTNRTISFAMKNGVAIYGGFAGIETALNQRPTINLTTPSGTTLSGDIGTVGNSADNSFHIIHNLPSLGLTTFAVLDGFVITGGNSNGTNPFEDIGGGILNRADGVNLCRPTIRNCLFTRNMAASGGGIANRDGDANCAPTITNCVFTSNTANGGGIKTQSASATVTGCLFTNNGFGGTGGGIEHNGATGAVTSCTFVSNLASSEGGAIYNISCTNALRFTNCEFVSNSASFGGGIRNWTASPVVQNCSFRGNSAGALGGGMLNFANSLPVITNSEFLGNTAGQGGGVCNETNSSATFINCSFSGNQATNGGGIANFGSSPGFRNTLVWANSAGVYNSDNTSVPSYTTTAVQSLSLGAGVFNGSTNPLFVNQPPVGLGTVGDLRLQTTSPAIDAGDPATTSATVGTTDLTGNPRFLNSRIDMGAFEFQCQAVTRLYVRAAATGTNTGLSWADAFTDLQSALTYPACSGILSEIWVANGIYKPTLGTARTVSFRMLPNVAIYGGFVGTETTLSQRPAINLTTPSGTTLSGEIGNQTSLSDNSFHVINNAPGLTNSAILDGFVITAGRATGTLPDNLGGGMLNRGNSSPLGCSPLIRNCLFINNNGTRGAGMYNYGLLGNSSPQLVNCIFQGNTGTEGLALYNDGTQGISNPTVVQCLFLNNTSGTGIVFNNGSGGNSSPGFASCTFRNNPSIHSTAPNNGTSAAQLSNCLIYNANGSSHFTNATAVGPTVQYSLLHPSATDYTSGPGNVTATSPPFANLNSPELAPNAPGVNAGNPTTTSASVGSTDLVGRPRFQIGGRIDMGAFEFQCQTASRFYVRASATGANTGLTWADAFPDLQHALNYPCAVPIAEIWVANGIYRPTQATGPDSRTVSFTMLPSVAIYGGFLGTETTLSQRPAINLTTPSRTFLSGEIGSFTTTADNSFNVIRNGPGLTSTAILDGFVIVSGNASNTSLPGSSGGGMYNDGTSGVCSPLIRNCTFRNNQATNGGAVFNTGYSGNASPQFVNCRWTSNEASSQGGAVYNIGSQGISSPKFTNCLFDANKAVFGGVMGNNGSAGVCSATLTNCTLQSNTATSLGSVFSGEGFNGGVANPLLTNCVVWGNVGGNAFTFSNATGTVARYTLFETGITNYSDVVGNLTTATSPFAGTATSRLATGSPAIDAADPATTTAVIGATDLAGYPRVFGARADMGAQESQCTATSITRLYVRPSITANANQSGLSWADAFPDLQTALNYPCLENVTGTPAAEIWVANGLYKPTSTTLRTVSFQMKPGIALYGGFVGTETALSQRPALNLTTPSGTTLSGEIGDPNSTTDNSANVIYNYAGLTSSAILDGFVVTGGNATVLPANDLWSGGGGMFNDAVVPGSVCTPTVRNVVFANNASNGRGGGMVTAGPSLSSTNTATISNCVFTGNTAQLSGGGLNSQGVNLIMTNSLFTNNRSIGGSAGGGQVFYGTNVLTSCTFVGNTALGGLAEGGGFNSYVSSNTITSCVFQSNTTVFGGGLNLGSATALVRNCNFFTNYVSSDGGGLISYRETSVTVVGSSFVGNRADINGGALQNEVSSTAIVTNSSFSGNTATQGGGIFNDRSALTLTTSSFDSNSANFGGALFDQSGSTLTNVSFSRNRGTTGGGAILYYGNPTTRSALTNVSFANNISGSGTDIYSFGGGASLTLTNGVVFSNGSGNSFAITGGSSLSVNYSLLDSSIPATAYTAGPGNLTTATSPFSSSTSTQLAVGSPAIDAGDPATTSATGAPAAVGLTDLAGNVRFINNRIDMGAYEFGSYLEIFSLKDGLWNDASLWSVGRLPQATERVRLKHAVTLPANFTGQSGLLIYDPASRLIYQTGGRLQMGQ